MKTFFGKSKTSPTYQNVLKEGQLQNFIVKAFNLIIAVVGGVLNQWCIYLESHI